MDAARWRRIDALFNQMLSCAPPERTEKLTRDCVDDSELFAEVEALLVAHERASSFMASPAFQAVPQLPGESLPAIAIGAHVGRYKVRSVLGRGGMGVVYEAEQDNPRRTVALKLIRPGFASQEMLRRFSHEAQLLGRLSHPGIAQIFEAGTAETPDARQPFFAMEVVSGEPITFYARTQRLGLAGQLEMFATVCDAVQYAHEKGVLHRDLKPGNILVTREGRAKVLDFGVARATDVSGQAGTSGGGDVTARTVAGEIIGTLAYMSPEQVSGPAHDLDTRSDIYALGVVLYELVTERLPYDLSGKNIVEAGRIIAEQRPPPIRTIRRELPADLDTILQKTLSKDRAQRYSSVDALASDIRRLLANRPILARPPSAVYQLRKFVARNRAATAIVAALFVVIVVAAVATGWLARKFQNQRDAARDERSRTAAAQTTAEKTTAFLERLFEQADPSMQATADPKVRDLLDAGLAKLDSELNDEPLIRARLQSVIGLVYARLGDFAKSRELLESSIALIRQHGGHDHPDLIDPLNRLARSLVLAQTPEKAETPLRERLRICERQFGPRSEQAAGAHEDLGAAFHYAGNLDGAERHLRQSLDIRRGLFGEESAEIALSLHNLGHAQLRLGQLDSAEESLQNALRIRRKLLGTHVSTALTVEALAHVAFARGKPEVAEQYLREQLDIVRCLNHAMHPGVAWVLNNLGFLVARNCGPAEAEPFIREALAIRRTAFGDAHHEVANSLSDLASTRLEQGGFDEAIEMYLEALDIRRTALGDHHDFVGNSLRNLGVAYQRSGQPDAALSNLLESYDVFVKNHGPDDPIVIPTVRALDTLYQQLNMPEEAERWRDMIPPTNVASHQ